MNGTLLVSAVLVLLSAAARAAADGPGETLDPGIPAADPTKYAAVRDAKDWANPYLVVRADAIEVVSPAVPGGRKLVAAGDLSKALAALPVSAWPYGRVAAAQEVGVRAGRDGKPVERNRAALVEALKGLAVEVAWWPTA